MNYQEQLTLHKKALKAKQAEEAAVVAVAANFAAAAATATSSTPGPPALNVDRSPFVPAQSSRLTPGKQSVGDAAIDKSDTDSEDSVTEIQSNEKGKGVCCVHFPLVI